jgi:NAD(P)-dependent dehydrogenase (short-subunit alcohol dehydrogenase family)
MTVDGPNPLDASRAARPFRGQVVIVTGAAGGIGGCVARHFAGAGASVMLADIREDGARGLADEITSAGGAAAHHPVDISDPTSARALAEATLTAFGSIDVLVHAAAIDAPRGVAWECDDAHWLRIIDVDLSGAFWCAKAVIPQMIAQKRGRIILISSIASRTGSHNTSVAYNAAKGGINGLTIGLSAQLEEKGILVNAIAPGSIGTGEPMTPEEILHDETHYAMGIVGPDPVARACLYLAGESGDWVSGTILNVSGGRWRGGL